MPTIYTAAAEREAQRIAAAVTEEDRQGDPCKRAAEPLAPLDTACGVDTRFAQRKDEVTLLLPREAPRRKFSGLIKDILVRNVDESVAFRGKNLGTALKSGAIRLLSNDQADFKWDLRRAKGGYDARYHAVLVNTDAADGRTLEGREEDDDATLVETRGNPNDVRAVNIGCHVDKSKIWDLTGYAHIFNAAAIDGRPGQGDPLRLEFDASYGIPRGEIRIASTGQAVARMASARRTGADAKATHYTPGSWVLTVAGNVDTALMTAICLIIEDFKREQLKKRRGKDGLGVAWGGYGF